MPEVQPVISVIRTTSKICNVRYQQMSRKDLAVKPPPCLEGVPRTRETRQGRSVNQNVCKLVQAHCLSVRELLWGSAEWNEDSDLERRTWAPRRGKTVKREIQVFAVVVVGNPPRFLGGKFLVRRRNMQSTARSSTTQQRDIQQAGLDVVSRCATERTYGDRWTTEGRPMPTKAFPYTAMTRSLSIRLCH